MYLMFRVYYEQVNFIFISQKTVANDKHRVYSCLSSSCDSREIGVTFVMQTGDEVEQTICSSDSN